MTIPQRSVLLNRLFCIILLSFFYQGVSFGQPSFSTEIKFRLFDEHKELVDTARLHKEFRIATLNIPTITAHYSTYQRLWFDAESQYYLLRLSNVPPEFNFAIYHEDMIMTLFLPFDYTKEELYALDIHFQEGDFLLDFTEEVTSGQAPEVYLEPQLSFYFEYIPQDSSDADAPRVKHVPFAYYLIEQPNWPYYRQLFEASNKKRMAQIYRKEDR